ncbi:MAG TPA: alpha/beta fold hydrolase [Thiomonas arsenitoxydans]|jgi:3-oxoadipate enol-lactonase|uniref:alpha/beta fold hydrolase n=1 Tax=Thiomonas arsenitoxydans (strain DSM 22701 / CIP 110005 / 3As) TaxID=426114 RepID=UPI002B8ADC9C|nr:alpha/beta fold hydrolase [Thiomonas arsenitoxydans]HML83237.1 alpha/beta fold hydrolase [Thiomonas arsenitoxydans]
MNSRAEIGQRELLAIDGEHGSKIVNEVASMSPTLSHGLVDFAFGEVFARAELGRRDREMITAGILGAMGGAEPQLCVHLNAALNVGADGDELIALAEHVAVYSGFPRALNLLREVISILNHRKVTRSIPPKRVRVGDHEVDLVDTGGELPPVILLHALGLDHRMWRDVIPILARTNRVIAYDLRGHGRAALAPCAANMDAFVADLATVMDSLRIPKASIVGLSFGGGIAQCFAIQHPSKVDRLTLVATTAWAQPAFVDRAEAAERDGMQAQIVPTLTRWFTMDALAVNDWTVRYARERVLRAHVEDWAATWRSFSTIHIDDRLSEISCPTLLLAGEMDPSTPPALMEKLSKAIPSAQFHVIKGAPHMLSLESPGPLADRIAAFLATH